MCKKESSYLRVLEVIGERKRESVQYEDVMMR